MKKPNASLAATLLSAAKWFDGEVEKMAREVGREVDRKTRPTMPLYRIEHAAHCMALAAGIKRIADVRPDQLIRQASAHKLEESRKYAGRSWPKEALYRSFVFHFGYHLIETELKRMRRAAERKGGAE